MAQDKSPAGTGNGIVSPDKINNPYIEKHCEKAEEDRRSDLCAQWKAADAAADAAMWTKYGVWVGFLGLSGVLATFIYSHMGFRVARADLENTIKSQRPFLMPANAELRRLKSSAADQFGVFFNISNHGSEIGILQRVSTSVIMGKTGGGHSAIFNITNVIPVGGPLKTPIPYVDFEIASDDYRQLENLNVRLLGTIVMQYASISKRRWETIYQMEFFPHLGAGHGELIVRPNGWTDRELKPGE